MSIGGNLRQGSILGMFQMRTECFTVTHAAMSRKKRAGCKTRNVSAGRLMFRIRAWPLRSPCLSKRRGKLHCYSLPPELSHFELKT